MAVEFINQRSLKGITTRLLVRDLRALIEGLDEGYHLEVDIDRGYDSPRPGEGTAPSVTLIARNPPQSSNSAMPYYPPGVRG